MLNWRRLLGNERGVALVLALMMLMTLTGLMLAFLSVSALEPQISGNLADTARARYLAEAGIEAGFATLVTDVTKTDVLTNNFTPAITTATAGAPWVTLINNASLANVTTGGSAAEATFAGTYTVVVRNNFQAADASLVSPAVADAAVNVDTDKIVIMRSTGSFNGATRTIEVVVRRAPLPPFPGAVNLPGLQADTLFNKDNFEIDGRDYACTSSCDTASNWTALTPATSARPNKYGIATTNGVQTNLNPDLPYETVIENAANNSNKQGSIKGRDETVTGSGANVSYTTGVNTIQGLNPATDPEALSPAKMTAYLDAVSKYAGTTILQSTPTCRLVMTGTSGDPSRPTLSGLTSGGSACGTDKTLDLGTRSNPKLVYFRADLEDPSSRFIGLETRGTLKGAGVLVIEDGDLQQLADLTWDGVVIVTGRYVGAGFRSGSNTKIRGALVANEAREGEEAGFFEFLLDSGATGLSIKNSKQNLDMVQLMRGNTTMTNWREL
jgi:Tfp pilus assembly protein PilX